MGSYKLQTEKKKTFLLSYYTNDNIYSTVI